MVAHSIGRMLSPTLEAALLTRRRPIDYCRVAASLCPPAPRLCRAF
jgi:hypothetical protein